MCIKFLFNLYAQSEFELFDSKCNMCTTVHKASPVSLLRSIAKCRETRLPTARYGDVKRPLMSAFRIAQERGH